MSVATTLSDNVVQHLSSLSFGKVDSINDKLTLLLEAEYRRRLRVKLDRPAARAEVSDELRGIRAPAHHRTARLYLGGRVGRDGMGNSRGWRPHRAATTQRSARIRP